MSEKMDFAGGKYTVINDNGKLTALRHGEPWGRDEDLVGDKLVYSMLVDSLALKAQRDQLLEAAKEAEPMLQAMLDNIRKTLPQYTKMPALDKLSAAIKAAEGEKE